MIEKKIHIVAFDVPYPADYGGVIDIYYRIKALHELGFKITLHCFEYGRGKQEKLTEITESIFYYPRKKKIIYLFNSRPFIVISRKSDELLNRLLQDKNPILFEGLHTTWYLENTEICNRSTFVRTHNIEHDYYAALAKKGSFLKRFFFLLEAKKLKKYEAILANCGKTVCIKESDIEYFKTYNSTISLLPASTPNIKNVEFKLTEEFALFTGNLSVSENENAVRWIIQEIWKKDNSLIPLKIAGKNPSKKLKEFIQNEGVILIENPSQSAMEELLSTARIHVLVSDQSTGVKLKLIAALQTSGHILVNPTMVEGTNLKNVCTICATPSDFISQIKLVENKELDFEAFSKRRTFLEDNFDTVKNCSVFL